MSKIEISKEITYDDVRYLLANVMSEMDENECRQKFAALPAELKRLIDGRWEQTANFGSFVHRPRRESK